MRLRAPKDAARWHKSGVNRIAGSASAIFPNQSHWWTENDPLSARVCMNGLLPPLVLAHPHHSSDPRHRPPGTSVAAGLLLPQPSHVHTCVLPRLPNGFCSEFRTDYRISSKSHFAVANCGCFYTFEGTRPLSTATQALRILGHLPSAFWLSLFRELRAPGRQHSGHATEFTGTADDAAL